jgi:type IV pilus assembly protein PilC
MGMSDLMINYWFAIVPGTLLLAYGTWRWLKSEGGTAWWHSTQLRLPILGPMYRRLHLSRGLRMLGTLGGAGVGLVDCLDTARQLASNVWYQALWEDVAEQIRVGRPVSEPLRDSDLAAMLVPPSVVQMIRAGETGGKLSEVAEKVAGYAERELRQSVDQATRYIEPAMIVLMGGLIGGITMALLLPVFTVGRVIGQG